MLSVLYRGPLASCNYGCAYCPFAKHASPAKELNADREALARFVAWVAQSDRQLGILFTPWGEALVRSWYRDALVTLSHLPQVGRVAVQTNLSGPLEWLASADKTAAALWVSYHPSEIVHERFVARCRRLDQMGIRYSVGVVGLADNLAAAQRMRHDLDERVPMWVNAYDRASRGYYSPELTAAFEAIDPLFRLGLAPHQSLGQPCHTGMRAISVDGGGDVRRCHFVPERLGNLHRDPLEAMLRERRCPREHCDCFIGYAHLEPLGLDEVFGAGLLERYLAPARSPAAAGERMGAASHQLRGRA